MSNPLKSKTRISGNSSVSIREMSLSDLPEIYSLGEQLFPADKWPTLYRTWDEYELATLFASDRETCLVAELDNTVVGFALGTLLEKRGSAWNYGYLLWLGIDNTIERKGIATRLFERITDIFIKLGARMVMVDTDAGNETALSFFRSQGFGHESPHLFLSRNLSHDPDYIRHRRLPRTTVARKRAVQHLHPNYVHEYKEE
jgi:ribosomal protein S18 acetylase RimI-like enzyme